jgi:hypothetical protein
MCKRLSCDAYLRARFQNRGDAMSTTRCLDRVQQKANEAAASPSIPDGTEVRRLRIVIL